MLEIKGNFTQTAGNNKNNFKPIENQKVILTGDKGQIVSFTSLGSSSFNILESRNTSIEGINFATGIMITKLFDHYGNKFTISDVANSFFPDYDKDELSDNYAPYPLDLNRPASKLPVLHTAVIVLN